MGNKSITAKIKQIKYEINKFIYLDVCCELIESCLEEESPVDAVLGLSISLRSESVCFFGAFSSGLSNNESFSSCDGAGNGSSTGEGTSKGLLAGGGAGASIGTNCRPNLCIIVII